MKKLKYPLGAGGPPTDAKVLLVPPALKDVRNTFIETLRQVLGRDAIADLNERAERHDAHLGMEPLGMRREGVAGEEGDLDADLAQGVGEASAQTPRGPVGHHADIVDRLGGAPRGDHRCADPCAAPVRRALVARGLELALPDQSAGSLIGEPRPRPLEEHE